MPRISWSELAEQLGISGNEDDISDFVEAIQQSEREACAEKARTAEILLRCLAGIDDNHINILSLREEARNYFRRSNAALTGGEAVRVEGTVMRKE